LLNVIGHIDRVLKYIKSLTPAMLSCLVSYIIFSILTW